MTLISELFEMPERVHHGDFVLKLTDGHSTSNKPLIQFTSREVLPEPPASSARLRCAVTRSGVWEVFDHLGL
jgi:hypothetical protein